MRGTAIFAAGVLTVGATALTDCGNNRFCLESQTCVSGQRGAGLKYGCAPGADAVICEDARFSCPAASACGSHGDDYACLRQEAGAEVFVASLQDNLEATTKLPLASASVGTPSALCEIIAGDLPSRCTCEDHQFGGVIDCRVAIIFHDTIGVRADILPCDDTAHVDLVVTESKHSVNITVAGIGAGHTKNFPIPFASVDIPKIGSVGLDASVRVDGDLDTLHLEIGLDACAQVAGHEACGAQLTRFLPIWLLKGSYHFGDFCKGESLVV